MNPSLRSPCTYGSAPVSVVSLLRVGGRARSKKKRNTTGSSAPRCAHSEGSNCAARFPSFSLHKASGQAVVRLNGYDHFLGPFDSSISRERYARLIAEWEANGRARPVPRGCDAAIAQVIAAFWRHAKSYYRRPDGTPTSELTTFKAALRPLHRLYGSSVICDFGPLALQAVRTEMVRLGWSRRHINKHVNRIRMMVRCAESAAA